MTAMLLKFAENLGFVRKVRKIRIIRKIRTREVCNSHHILDIEYLMTMTPSNRRPDPRTVASNYDA